jgi:hypothetical protein
MCRKHKVQFIIATLLSLPLHAGGVELQVQYSAIQKVLAQQMFIQDGRMYVRGTPADKCSYAFLEAPVVGGLDGLIEIKALFHGKNATSFLGRCWGLGDVFELRIVAAPYFENGLIRLRDVNVETVDRKSYYSKKVRESITDNLGRRFEYRVADEAKRILERKVDPREPYQQYLQSFQVSQIRVTPAALVLMLDFTLVVK